MNENATNDVKISVREWIDKFNAGEFTTGKVEDAIKSGFYDWFCKDDSLTNKVKWNGPKIKTIAKSEKINKDDDKKEDPKVEDPKADAPKVDVPKADAPKISTSKKTSPKDGDNNELVIYICLMGFAAAAITAGVYRKKKSVSK